MLYGYRVGLQDNSSFVEDEFVRFRYAIVRF